MQKYALFLFYDHLFFQIKSLIPLSVRSKSLILFRVFDSFLAEKETAHVWNMSRQFSIKKETAHVWNMSRRFCVKDAGTNRGRSALNSLIDLIISFPAFFMQMKNTKEYDMLVNSLNTFDNGRYGYKIVTKQTKSLKNSPFNLITLGGSNV